MAKSIYPSTVERSSSMHHDTANKGATTSKDPKTSDNVAHRRCVGCAAYDYENSDSDGSGEDGSSDEDDDSSDDDNSSDDVFWIEPPKGKQSIAIFELIKIPAPGWWRIKKEPEAVNNVLPSEATALSFFSSRSGSPTRFRPARRVHGDLIKSSSAREDGKRNLARTTKRRRDGKEVLKNRSLTKKRKPSS
ncbi:hypothetical protein MBLNU457_3100t1 [Dothideomycetes sp. NU457]